MIQNGRSLSASLKVSPQRQELFRAAGDAIAVGQEPLIGRLVVEEQIVAGERHDQCDERKSYVGSAPADMCYQRLTKQRHKRRANPLSGADDADGHAEFAVIPGRHDLVVGAVPQRHATQRDRDPRPVEDGDIGRNEIQPRNRRTEDRHRNQCNAPDAVAVDQDSLDRLGYNGYEDDDGGSD